MSDKNIEVIYKKLKGAIEVCDFGVSQELAEAAGEFVGFALSGSDEARKEMEANLYHLIDRERVHSAILLFSGCLATSSNADTLEAFYKYILECKEISSNTRYFLYYQLNNVVFRNIYLETQEVKLLKWQLLEKVVAEFRDELADLLVPIPQTERDMQFSLVITEQLVSEVHAPTKITLNRCKTLMECCGKRTLLLNTAELFSQEGEVPFFNVTRASYEEDLNLLQGIQWQGMVVPFFQCNNNMPNADDLRELLLMVRQMKPGLVLVMGGTSILANLIDNMIPVLAIGMSPSDLGNTTVTCQTLSRQLNGQDIELLERMNLTQNHVIESIFTSTLKTQTKKVTRLEMGLPEDKFIIAVVGYRLDADIDASFIEMLRNVLREDICIAFIGEYAPYEKLISYYPEFKETLKVLGRTDDILAWIENCDLYLNPCRKGGGTSSVEALYKGVPVVTTAYGDVAVNVGKDFWAESFEKMPELVLKYKEDKVFYQQMSAKAKERAAVLLDTEKEFARIIEEFEKRCEIINNETR